MAGSRILQIVLTGRDNGALGTLAGLGKKTDETTGKLTGFGAAGTAAMVSVGTAVAGLALKSSKTFEKIGSDVTRLQRYTGSTAEDASRLRFALQQAGVDSDTFSKSLGILSKKLEGSKDPAKDFGVNVRDASGQMLPMNDALLVIAERFESMPNGMQKNALALKLFGRAGLEMLPFLNRGREGISALMAETDKYGLVLSKDQLKAVKQSKEAHRDLTAALEGLQVKVGTSVLPKMTALTNVVAGIPGPVMDVAGPALTAGAALGGIAVVVTKVSGAVRPALDYLGNLDGKLRGAGSSAVSSGAAMAGYAAGIGLTIAAIQKMNSDSEASNNTLFKGLEFTDLEAANRKLNETGEKINAMGAKWDSYSGAQKLAHAEDYKLWNDASAQQEEHRRHLDAAIETTHRLGAALGATAKETEGFLTELKIDPTQVPFDQLVDTLTRWRAGTITASEAQRDLAGATNEATDAAKAQSDALAAALNPMFGMAAALEGNTDAQAKQAQASRDLVDAQKAYDYAVLTTLPTSQQQRDAYDKLTAAKAASTTADQAAGKSALEVAVAADKLNASVKAGETSVDSAKESLARFVEQGLINQQTADNLASKFGWAAYQADELAKDRAGTVTVTVTAIADAAAQAANLLAGGGGNGPKGTFFGATFGGNWSGGNLSRGLNLVGERGPELVDVGSNNVTAASSTARALSLGGGGLPPITVIVQGNVTTERDLVESIRNGLVDLVRVTPGAVLPGVAG